MRLLLKLLVVLSALLAAIWIGSEALLARQAAKVIANEPQLRADAVRELREAGRVGVRIERFDMDGPEGRLALPWLDLWVPPLRPNEVHVSLPHDATAVLAGRRMDLTAEAAEMHARFAPAHAMTLAEAQLRAGKIALDGRQLVERIGVVLTLTGYGADAPPHTGAAYDVAVDIAALSLADLVADSVQSMADMRGGGRLWLDSAPGRDGSVQPPRLLGVRADGVEIGLDGLDLRIWGRVLTDAERRLDGTVLIDTADIDRFVARAAATGLLPQAMAPLARTMLKALGSMAIQPGQPAADDALSARDQVAQPGLMASNAFPPPQPGELRIPLSFREGRTFFGPIAIGPAPQLPR